MRPHLEFASVIWSPKLKKEKNLIEQVQRRATRLVPELKGKTYPERLQALQLETLQYRRVRADVLETFRIMSGAHQVNLDTHCHRCPGPGKHMFTKSLSTTTRGHSMKLQAQKSVGIRHSFFSERVLNIWNSLDQDTINSPNINIFKSRINNQLERFCPKFNYTF